MSKLNFKVVSCSSEEESFPAKELNMHGPQTKGWQSSKFPEYPQEIGISMNSYSTTISQIQLLGHQVKIATKIEVFIGQGSSYDTAQFKRLGYLSLDSNERSNYKARELKTVYIDNMVGNFVRLLIHKNHVNTQNLFNQVAIVAINILGTEASSLGQENDAELSTALPVQSRSIDNTANSSRMAGKPTNDFNDLAADMNLDPQTANKIRQLAEAKAKAVANEDYNTAKQIKVIEGELRHLGAKLAQIDISKRQAVMSEEYDLARELKAEGDDLRVEIERMIRSINIPGMNESLKGNVFPSFASDPSLKDAPGSSRDVGGVKEDDNSNNRDNYDNSNNEDDDDARPIRPKAQMSYDDYDPSEKIEANNNGAEEDGLNALEGLENVNQLPIPEALQGKGRDIADQNGITALIGEYRSRCLFSKTWSLREAAISKVTMLLQSTFISNPGVSAAIPALLTIIRIGLEDKIQNVYIASCDLLSNLLSIANTYKLPKLSPALMDPIINILFDRIADATAKVRDAGQTSLVELISSPLVGPLVISPYLLKAISAKQLSNWRLLLGKIKLIKELVSGFGLGQSTGMSSDSIMTFLKSISAFSHGNGDVRDAARDLTVAVHRVVGTNALEPYLKDLRDKQLAEYHALFEKNVVVPSNNTNNRITSNSSKNQVSSNQSSNKSKSSDNRNHQQNQQTSSPRSRDAPVAASEEDEDFTKCLFCGMSDRSWTEDSLDLHYVQKCPFLMSCPGCNQYIEVAAIPAHLLEECEARNDYVECEKTGLAIRKVDFDPWRKSKNCRVPPNECIICPLCFSTVEDYDESWRHHLEQGCPKHARNRS